MGCCGDREKGVASMEEKWDYVVRIGVDATRAVHTDYGFIEPR
jgi:hypothetical protein